MAHPLIDPSRLKGARRIAKMPRFVPPELATLVAEAPLGDNWLHEVKLDGYRIVSRIENGSVTMYSRNDKDWTERFRVLAGELAAWPVESAMLDGEAVVQLPDGATDFQELQNMFGRYGGKASHGDDAGRLLYYVFDLLYLNGYELLNVPLEERRELLKHLVAQVSSDRVVYSEHLAADGRTVLEQVCKLGLEGVVSKKAEARYRPGVRGPDWLKTKCRHEQEFVIGGYTDPAGTRMGFGALLLGVQDRDGLRYVGRVGTGFNNELLRGLGERLRKLEVDGPAFSKNLPAAQKGLHWVRPELVAEVAFMEWTKGGGIRHPSFKGLRADKSSAEVVAEIPTDDDPVNGVTLTHPERVFWPLDGITKRELVAHYDRVAALMLPYVLERPVAMVRCPAGISELPANVRQGGSRAGPCFFHKHPADDFPGPIGRVMITESGGSAPYLTITEAGSLTALAQMGVLEIHIWGSTWPDIEHPDMLVFDLDPDPAVSWPALAGAARLLRDVLRAVDLESFAKTTGGKGLHVVVPITPSEGWEEVRLFCKRVAEIVASRDPDRFTANMAKAKRGGKIYIDYVRNNRGATSIAPYSTRAKERATVAVPLRWAELSGRVRPDYYTVENLSNRLKRLGSDPWEGYFETQRAQTLTPAMKDALT